MAAGDTVGLGWVVRRAAEESYLALRELVDKSKAEAAGVADGGGSSGRSDAEKKIDLLKFVSRTRQRMLRLHVLAKWCQQVPLVHYCQQLVSTLSSHETCFTQTADSLFYMHEGLQQARAPLFDVPSAIEVLLSGNYRRLPKCVEEIGMQNALLEDEQKPALKKLDTIVRTRLLETVLPREITEISVSDGIAILRVDGEFKVLLTLGYRGHLNLWRILHMELLVGDKNGPVQFEETRRYALGDDLERRMVTSENPFVLLYNILHELCISLVMDTVVRQTQVLRQGRWKDAIKFDYITDGLSGQTASSAITQLGQDGELDSTAFRIPSLKITYWLEIERSCGGTTYSDIYPYIKIETGQDMQIKCTHSYFILDLFSNKEATLSLDLSCIDVEQLLLQAITCGRHTRLLEIMRELQKDVQISQSSDDVVLKLGDLEQVESQVSNLTRRTGNYCRNESLHVRAYGHSYISLGINIRSGRFLLQLSKNILPSSVLLDAEEALNKASMTATEVFVVLRTKSILHQFASTGQFLGLKVYDQSQSQNMLKIPNSITHGSDQMLMGFPQCGSAYFLSIQLDSDFRPLFHLLEAQHDAVDKSPLQVVRHSKIDIGDMLITKTKSDTMELDRLQYQHNVVTCGEMLDGDPTPLSSLECTSLVPGLKTSFSSVVDEVFESENGSVGAAPEHKSNAVQCSDVQQLTLPANYSSPWDQGEKSALGNHSTPGCTLEKISKKRSLQEFLLHNSSLKSYTEQNKRRRISASDGLFPLALQQSANSKPTRNMLNKNLSERHCATSSIYASVLFHVIRHCSLSIKHAQLTSQMDALDIPYVEEVGLRNPSSSLWLRLPFSKDDSWKQICLCLGKSGSMSWDVRINDPHFKELWELHRGSKSTLWGSGVRIANTSEIDSHISFDSDGVILAYETVVTGSVQKLVSDLRRLSNARLFSCGMRRLIGMKVDDKLDENQTSTEVKSQSATKAINDAGDRLSEQMRKTFRIEAVGLMSLWFSYGSMPTVHFVVEWESGKEGCTMHVSPDQLWPHTKFLEDFVNGGDVATFLDCVRLTAGPLLALGGAIRPARMPVTVSGGYVPFPRQNNSQLPGSSASTLGSIAPVSVASSSVAAAHLGNSSVSNGSMLSASGRGGPGLVPSTLLPFDVSVVLRGPYWVRIIYRKKFSVDMRCFAGDQVWLQPGTPPKGGPSVGGSLPCPHFRPFIMEHVAQGLHTLEPSFINSSLTGLHPTLSNAFMNSVSAQPMVGNAISNVHSTTNISRPPAPGVGNQMVGNMGRASNSVISSSGPALGMSGALVRQSPGSGVHVNMKGELNTAFIGLGDDGGYGGGWVPLAALKKVLRAILKYLGVLWLFAQLPDLLKEILGSILKENEGALLNLDPEQPALRFFVGGYVFAVSVHRVQLLLQVLSVKRFHHHQQQQAQSNSQEELATAEINEICDYFSRRVASEPYDASRVASFITLLTLPISVFREFLKLIAWKKGLSQAHGGDIATAQKARIELCLENHLGIALDGTTESLSTSKSNILHDRGNSFVEFALTFVLDNSLIPHVVVAGGAAWLPYCVSVKLRYSFLEETHINFREMVGSHGGRACWSQYEEWEKCKQRVVKAVEAVNGPAVGDASLGRIRLVAEMVQKTLQVSLQQMRDGPLSAGSTAS